MTEYHDTFLDGNEMIEEAIDLFYADRSRENLDAVLNAIRERMHADGHFIFPILTDEGDENRFAFRSLQTADGKIWNAAFTSKEEYEKGESSQVLSNFIDSTMKLCLKSETDGFVINPWSQSFLLSKEMMEWIFKADGDVEYSVPDGPITPELLEDGSFLKRAAEICKRNRTPLNMMKLARILRDSWIWIPCNAIMSDTDYTAVEKVVLAAADGEGLDSLAGQVFTTKDEVRLVPDILQSGEEFFFPVFTTSEEMGEYGEHFSTIEKHFLDAIHLAVNNEKNVSGIVINAFTYPFVIPREMFAAITEMNSSFDSEANE